jgi:CHRD domain
MNTHWSRAAAALAIVIAAVGTMLACSDDPTGPQSTTYVAQLSGTNEVPGLSVGATGTATFTLNGKSLSYRVTVRGLSGNAAASHIHFGAAGTNGNIVYPFSAAAVQNGEVASGIIDLTLPVSNGQASISGDSLLTLLNRGLLYTNVHTAAHPGGEIRGQITTMASGGSGGGGGSGY